MKGLARLSLAAMLLLGAGCAVRPDWIQSTLVTADLTGVWRGTAGSRSLTLALEQRGPKVTGRIDSGPNSGALEGTVGGDVFRFRSTLESLSGEATVAGDEMTGRLNGTLPGVTGSGGSSMFLRRADSSAPREQQMR